MASLVDASRDALDALLKAYVPKNANADHLDHQQSEWDRLDSEARTLQDSLAVFIDYVARRKSDVRRRQNQLIPVYRLPTELLVHIFRLACEEGDDWKHSRDISNQNLTIAHVSARWYTTAVAIPQLWNRLDSSHNFRLTEIFLCRSQNTSLRIICPPGVDPIHERRFLGSVIPKLDRWEDFESYSDEIVHFMESAIRDNEAPALTRFSLGVGGHLHNRSHLPNLFKNCAPNLLQLNILSFSFPLDSKVLSSLTDISFTASVGSIPFTLHQYRLLFSTSPNLESIYVDGLYHRGNTELESTALNVELPYLKNLQLHRVLDSHVAIILSILLPSSEHQPHVIITSPDSGIDLVLAFPESPDNTIFGSIRRMTWLSASQVRDKAGVGHTARITAGIHDQERKRIRFELRAPLGSPWLLFTTIIPEAGLPQLREMEVEGRSFTERLGPQLYSLPGLEVLSVSQTNRTAAFLPHSNLLNLHRALSTPIFLDGEDIPKWACPKLKVLTFGSGFDFEEILDMIRTRCIVLNVPVSWCTSLPGPLQKLQLLIPSHELPFNRLQERFRVELAALCDALEIDLQVRGYKREDFFTSQYTSLELGPLVSLP